VLEHRRARRSNQLSKGSKISMSKVTELAAGQITAVDAITVELVEAMKPQPSSSSGGPVKPTVCHPRRFPDTAATIARMFAEAATTLASIKAGRRL
jgi:hypothetical protein